MLRQVQDYFSGMRGRKLLHAGLQWHLLQGRKEWKSPGLAELVNRLIVAGCPGGNVSAHARGRQDLRHSVAYEAGWRTVRDPTRAASPAVAAQLGHSLKSAAQYTFRHLVAFPVGQEQEGELNFKSPPPPPPSRFPPTYAPGAQGPVILGGQGGGPVEAVLLFSGGTCGGS